MRKVDQLLLLVTTLLSYRPIATKFKRYLFLWHNGNVSCTIKCAVK